MLFIGEVGDEEERVLADDFYYDFDDLVSKPYASEGIPAGLLSLQYPSVNCRLINICQNYWD